MTNLRHSTLPRVAALLVSAAILLSCASRMIRDDSLNIEVVPLPVERGKTGRVTIDAPLDAQEVLGVVRVAGSPKFIFAKDKKKGLWYFSGTIPFSPWITPGEYTLRIIVKSPPEKDRYAEMKVELK